MHTRLSALIFTGAALLQGALAQQTTTLNIFPGNPRPNENVQGEMLGVGPEGTTFAVSGIFSGLPATVTIVKGSTYFSEVFNFETAGAKGHAEEACSIDGNGAGLCTAVVTASQGGIKTALTSVSPATFTFAPIAIKVTSGPDSSPDSGSSNANSASPLPGLAVLVAVVPLFGAIATLW